MPFDIQIPSKNKRIFLSCIDTFSNFPIIFAIYSWNFSAEVWDAGRCRPMQPLNLPGFVHRKVSNN